MLDFRRYVLLFVSIIFVISLFTSCGKSDNNSGNKIKVDNIYKGSGKFDRDTLYISALNVDTPTNDSLVKHDILNVGINSISRRSFNPYFAESKCDVYIIDSLWEPLMKRGYDGEYYPNILKQLPTVSEDKTTYLFSLREDLAWEDGTKLTTKDIEFTYKFLMDNSYSGSFDRELLNIKNWLEYKDGTVDYIAGLEILDDYNFKVMVETPNVYTLDLLNIYPLSFSYYGQYYYQGGSNQLESVDIRPFGNGVFKFLGYEENKYLILESNSFHFKGKSNINTLTYKVIDMKNFINDLTSGNVDIVRDVFLNDENLLKISKVEFLSGYIFPSYRYASIGINHSNSILKDINVRKAINLCIDKSEIVKKISDNNLDILDAPIDRNFYNLFYDKDEVNNDFNKNTAMSFLEKSGWKKGLNGFREKEGQKLEFKFLIEKDDLIVSKIFPLVKKDLESIGISVVSEEVDKEIFKLNSKDMKNIPALYDLFLMNPNFNFESNWFKSFSTNGMNNFYYYSNSYLDELLYNISVEFDVDKSKELYQKAYETIKEDIPIVALFQEKQFDVYNGRILGINSANIFKTFYYDEIILKK